VHLTHLATHFKCTVCATKGFLSQAILDDHTRTHHPLGGMVCDLCHPDSPGARFDHVTLRRLMNHKKSHDSGLLIEPPPLPKGKQFLITPPLCAMLVTFRTIVSCEEW
jgi:hypothetical protein